LSNMVWNFRSYDQSNARHGLRVFSSLRSVDNYVWCPPSCTIPKYLSLTPYPFAVGIITCLAPESMATWRRSLRRSTLPRIPWMDICPNRKGGRP
jgi:hypothetical protein